MLYPRGWPLARAGLLVTFLAIDVALPRHVAELIVAVSGMLALRAALVLLDEFLFQIVIVAVALSLLIILDDFREIRGR